MEPHSVLIVLALVPVILDTLGLLASLTALSQRLRPHPFDWLA
jgi:hypothetical protein